MGEEDRNPDIIREVNKELCNVRKEQRIMRLWGGVLLSANLLLLGGFLWVLTRETKQPVPAETAFQFPPSAPPAEEDSSIWIADNVSDNVSNTENAANIDHVDNTDETDNMHADTAVYDTDDMDETNNTDYTENTDRTEESPSSPVPVAVTPTTTRPVTARPPIVRTVKTAVRSRPKKTVAAIPAYIITRPGMTLRSLARLYYGSEVFWVYIYDRNMRVMASLDTSSFDVLPSGIQLELPRPADYGIDATEPISLQRACKQAKSLVKQ